MNRVDRLFGYLLLLQTRQLVKARDLAERFEISERTVYRDMQALSEIGVPLLSLPGEGYRLMEGYYLPPIAFSLTEARSLFLAVEMLASGIIEGATRDAAQAAMEKIRAVLPEATKVEVETLTRTLHFLTFPSAQLDLDDPKFAGLQEAIRAHQVVKILYHAQSSNEVTARQVEPESMAFVNGVWLLTGYCRLRSAIRHFRLDRIDRIETNEETFEPRAANRQRTFSEPIQVTIRFRPSVSRWVGERQHYSFQSAEETPQGLLAYYSCRNLENFSSWLMQWAPNFRVMEPPELRARIENIARQLLEDQAAEYGL